MAIYGNNTSDDDVSEPIALSEVTFQLSAEDLRRVARFLLAIADDMEAGTFTDGGRHLKDHDQQWVRKNTSDVIVVPPTPSPPSLPLLPLP